MLQSAPIQRRLSTALSSPSRHHLHRLSRTRTRRRISLRTSESEVLRVRSQRRAPSWCADGTAAVPRRTSGLATLAAQCAISHGARLGATEGLRVALAGYYGGCSTLSLPRRRWHCTLGRLSDVTVTQLAAVPSVRGSVSAAMPLPGRRRTRPLRRRRWSSSCSRLGA
jgi:hypothetical protein